MKRPNPGAQFFAGPYVDVAPGDDTFSPLQKESLYCAPCHTARFWGTLDLRLLRRMAGQSL